MRRGAVAAIAATVTLTALALSGCSSSSASSSSGTSDGKKTMAFLAFDTTNPWIATMVKGAQQEAKKEGITLTVSNGNNDNATQVAQVQDAIAKHVSAIIVQAADSQGIVPAIQQADAANIPIFAVNANVASSAKVISFVGADQSQMGVGAAQLVEKALPDGGNVALVQGVPGNPITTVRTTGFQNELAKNSKYKLVATVTDNFTTANDLSAVQDLLSKYPKGQLGAIVAQGGQLYVGAKYAASVGRTDVKFIANDYPVQVQQAIKDGQMYGTVDQDGAKQGIAVIDAANNWISGKKDKVERPTQYIPLPLVTKDNVGQYSTSWKF
jgi:ABC-type sugar transport system substrate-binding protein